MIKKCTQHFLIIICEGAESKVRSHLIHFPSSHLVDIHILKLVTLLKMITSSGLNVHGSGLLYDAKNDVQKERVSMRKRERERERESKMVKK